MTGTLHIVLAMKPIQGSFTDNARKHGVAGINIDGSRIGTGGEVLSAGAGGLLSNVRDDKEYPADNGFKQHSAGRWPSNVILDFGASIVLGEQSGKAGACAMASGPKLVGPSGRSCMAGGFGGTEEKPQFYGDKGTASRFFKQVRGT